MENSGENDSFPARPTHFIPQGGIPILTLASKLIEKA